MRYLLGYDIGSSSVKASLIDAETGRSVAADHFPKQEMAIDSPRAGWAEQDPQRWWDNLVLATRSVLTSSGADPADIAAIGISYQMHGLVLVDSRQHVLRPAIIWCDSRAVPYGEKALCDLGPSDVLPRMLNSPGNFTASKLAWVKENEPEVYARTDKFLLPGDYVAMRLTGVVGTTAEGLSEAILWDFAEGRPSDMLLDYFGFSHSLLPRLLPVFGSQGELSAEAAAHLGLRKGTPVAYRAGDQPNNALSLGVLEPGEIASTAGTSGVVYGVTDRIEYDPLSRVNTFAHVNYTPEKPRLGILLCINGTGILNSWLRRNVMDGDTSYDQMNAIASRSVPGARGISVVPFGNGAERVLCNREAGCSLHGINFNIHDRSDMARAAQEGIVYSFRYGIDIMRSMGMPIEVIKAGHANMFLSPLFRQALADVSGARIELYETNGADGAARGAGIGVGIYPSPADAFRSLVKIGAVEPGPDRTAYEEAYGRWKAIVDNV